jgi:hypothetical protein
MTHRGSSRQLSSGRAPLSPGRLTSSTPPASSAAPVSVEFIKLERADVLTAERAGELLDDRIKPLPSFDDSLLAAA